MSGNFSTTSYSKKCVTCGRWGGTRDTGFTTHPVFVRFIGNTKGKCIGGGFANLQKDASATCDQWIKWTPLA